jgi:hypothetical protein
MLGWRVYSPSCFRVLEEEVAVKKNKDHPMKYAVHLMPSF